MSRVSLRPRCVPLCGCVRGYECGVVVCVCRVRVLLCGDQHWVVGAACAALLGFEDVDGELWLTVPKMVNWRPAHQVQFFQNASHRRTVVNYCLTLLAFEKRDPAELLMDFLLELVARIDGIASRGTPLPSRTLPRQHSHALQLLFPRDRGVSISC